VKLQITVRTTNDATRKSVLEAIERKAKAAAIGAGAPEPVVHVDPGEFTPALINDPELTRRMVPVLQEVLGKDRVHERPMSMGGEDFSQYGRAGVKTFYYWLGSVPLEQWAAAQREGARPLPPTHSDAYFPTPEPTIRTGVLTMSMALLNVAGK
jgi:hippurate hydrolase